MITCISKTYYKARNNYWCTG